MKAVSTAPLAERLRPQSLDEVLGQNQLLGPDSPLRRAFETEEWSSMIFWGPPGTGKTTLALLIAKKADLEFQSFSVKAIPLGPLLPTAAVLEVKITFFTLAFRAALSAFIPPMIEGFIISSSGSLAQLL